MDRNALDELALAAKAATPPLHARWMRVGLTDRLMIGIGDYILLMIIQVICLILHQTLLDGRKFFGTNAVYATLAAGTALLYSLPELWGGTLAKRIAGVRIGSMDGRVPTASQYIVRWSVKYSPLLLLVACASLEWMMAAGMNRPMARDLQGILSLSAFITGLVIFLGCTLSASQRRQALHDLIARTVVLREDRVRKRTYEGKGFEALITTRVEDNLPNRANNLPTGPSNE